MHSFNHPNKRIPTQRHPYWSPEELATLVTLLAWVTGTFAIWWWTTPH